MKRAAPLAAGAALVLLVGCPSGEGDGPGPTPTAEPSPGSNGPAPSEDAGAAVWRPARWSLGLAHVQRRDGVEVAFVFDGGPADAAGLEVGDLIVEIGGFPASKAERGQWRLVEVLGEIGEEASLDLVVRRGPDGDADELEVEVPLVAEGTFEAGLARDLIQSAFRQLVALRRDDGLWPSYADPLRPSVAVSALVAYALSRVDDEQVAAVRDNLIELLLTEHLGEDGGLEDPTEFPAHRDYATSLLLMAIAERDDLAEERTRLRDWLLANQVQEDRGFALYDWRYGGWSHYGSFEANVRVDVSTARYALQALAAAETPPGDPVWGRARAFLEATQNFAPLTAADDPHHDEEAALRDGGFAFSPRMSKAGGAPLGDTLYVHTSYGSATADGVLGLLAVEGVDGRAHTRRELPTEDPRILAGLRWLAGRFTLGDNPGFPEGNPWPAAIRYYFWASLAEALHGAGVWQVETSDGKAHAWAPELVLFLANTHAIQKGAFANRARDMHEDKPTIAAAFALIALAAARDRLERRGGALLEGGPPPPPRPVGPPPADAVERGQALFQTRGCVGCHTDGGGGNGPSLLGIGEVYLGQPGRLRRYLEDPDPARALRADEREDASPMPPTPAEDEAELDDLVEFLLSRLGERPVAEAGGLR